MLEMLWHGAHQISFHIFKALSSLKSGLEIFLLAVRAEYTSDEILVSLGSCLIAYQHLVSFLQFFYILRLAQIIRWLANRRIWLITLRGYTYRPFSLHLKHHNLSIVEEDSCEKSEPGLEFHKASNIELLFEVWHYFFPKPYLTTTATDNRRVEERLAKIKLFAMYLQNLLNDLSKVFLINFRAMSDILSLFASLNWLANGCIADDSLLVHGCGIKTHKESWKGHYGPSKPTNITKKV